MYLVPASLPSQERRSSSQRARTSFVVRPTLLIAAWAASGGLALAAELSGQDLRALDRLTYGSNDSSASAYAAAGRTPFWASQLHFAGDAALPPEARAAIQGMTITRVRARDIVGAHEEEERRLKELPEGDARQAQHKSLNERYRFVVEEAQRRRIIRALYSSNQLQEQLTWFWFNHFNVFQGKGKVKLLLADYEESAIRPHVLGRFRDLLLATIMHPAMLVYLDNAQNALGQINENYARELLELHTLGVDGGYTQQDVQELARILTGVGVNLESKPPRLGPRDARYYVGQGMFAFHPRRHDFGEKIFLGHRIGGRGFDEVAEVVDILSSHPSTARFVSRKLAVYFMGDEPPANVLQRMQDAFLASHGDIAHTLHVLFDSSEFWRDDYLGKKFKDPVQYVFSALRLAYDGRTITNYRPVQNWLYALGEPLYGHQTPDGYGLKRQDWASPAQLTKRFEIARHIANAGPRLFAPADSDDPAMLPAGEEASSQPSIAQSRVFTLMQPLLGERSSEALAQSRDNRDWTALFLSTPEFMYR
jgi:uncharacterized protein (DUF1800 family)/uncharacterized membrane protein